MVLHVYSFKWGNGIYNYTQLYDSELSRWVAAFPKQLEASLVEKVSLIRLLGGVGEGNGTNFMGHFCFITLQCIVFLALQMPKLIFKIFLQMELDHWDNFVWILV